MSNINNIWLEKGYVDEAVDKNINLVDEIMKLKKQKNVCIMVHYYQDNAIQDIADVIGDSLALAQKATTVDADMILICGVYFMGETIKILNPGKKVLIPDLNAACSLADSCKSTDFAAFKQQHPDCKVVSYVNTSAEIKALSDIVVTSSNAVKIVESFPKNQKLIFGPDRNLGSYINKVTGRKMILWDGCCHVHDRFSYFGTLNIKQEYPDYKLICHPECDPRFTYIADFVGSTAAMLKYVSEDPCKGFIVATESGIFHQMKLQNPDKDFVQAYYNPATHNDTFYSFSTKDLFDYMINKNAKNPFVEAATPKLNQCEYMRLCTLEKIYLTLKYEWPEVIVKEELISKARVSIDNMLNLS
ncbi:MAG: quinolinate synthase NadA [Bacteroidales bacterium]|nr:quinolinate synthase NadA [Bacteroidales bacterium]